MKKILLMTLLAASLLLGACGEDNNAEGAVETAESMQKINGVDADTFTDNMAEGIMIVGKVEEIFGNEVTLALGEVEGGMAAFRENMPEEREMTEEQVAAREEMIAGDGSLQRADGSDKFAERSEMSEEDRATMQEKMANGEMSEGGFGSGGMTTILIDSEITYTGETATYYIPVGLNISGSDYTSITEGMVLMLRMDEEESILSVSVVSQ